MPDRLAEQEQVASVLDKAYAIVEKRKRTLELADDLISSTFLEKFGDPVSNPHELPRAPIQCLGDVVTGNTPPRKEKDNYGSEIEWIKSDNINTPHHLVTPAEEGLSEKGRSLGRIVPAGSTLVTCIAGSPSVIGNAALTDRDVAFNQQINAVVPHKDTDPFFLYAQFLVGKKLIQESSTNSMKGMVSKGKFKKIEFLKPSYEDQREFGQIFRRALRIIEKINEDYSSARKLFGSISDRSFRGEF